MTYDLHKMQRTSPKTINAAAANYLYGFPPIRKSDSKITHTSVRSENGAKTDGDA